MAPENKSRKDLFKDVIYYDSSSVLAFEPRNVLDSGGAREYLEDGGVVDWDKITHVFTNNLDFPGRQDAIKRENLVIVTVSLL